MKYKLIASDVDGTLNNDRFEITPNNVAAIQKALKHDIKFVLCSGRSPFSLHGYEEQLGLNTSGQYGIGFNGSTVYDAHTKEVLFGGKIEKDLARRILGLVIGIDPSVKLSVYLQGNHMIAEQVLEDILAGYNSDRAIQIDYYPKLTPDLITSDVLSLYCIEYRPKLDTLYKALLTETLDGCEMAFTSEHLLEFMPPEMNKAQGLTRLCKHLGIQMSEVVTVGDNYNDIEMIRAGGYGIAVSNAVQELKTVADYVTKRSNNQDALEEVIELVLELNKNM